MGNSSNVIKMQPQPEISDNTMDTRRQKWYIKMSKKWRKIGLPANITTTKASDIMSRVDWLTLPAGNLNFPRKPLLGKVALFLWILNINANFAFDGFEAYKHYGYAWASTRLLDWFVFCLGTYLLLTRILPWVDTGLKTLEHNGECLRTLFKLCLVMKRLPFYLIVFALCACSFIYALLRVDKAANVEFGQQIPVAARVALHAWRLLSALHVFYVFALLWLLPVFAMQMVGYAMIEYQDLVRSRLRTKDNALTFREAVVGFNNRVQFAKDSSSACMVCRGILIQPSYLKVLLSLLFGSAVLSLAVNGYVFLYKTRYTLLIWYALMPLAVAIYPLHTAAWVTKQYHKHLVSVVKAWVEYPEASASEDEDEQKTKQLRRSQSTPNNNRKITAEEAKSLTQAPQMPNTDKQSVIHDTDKHLNVDDSAEIAEKRKQNLRAVLKGSVRALGRWQVNRKLPKFNFEKYVSYLDQVSRGTGFSVIGIIVTWELVSSILFFCFSVVALFLQESIFGKLKLAQ